MAICGYNEKIGDGLKLLVEGMIESLGEKMGYGDPSATIDREIVELDNIIEVLQTAHQKVLPEMFIGLNFFARALFLESRNKSFSRDAFTDECRRLSNKFVKLLAETENRHKELRKFGHDRAAIAALARELAQWAIEKSSSMMRFS